MKILKPIEVTEAILITNVVNEHADWDSGTNYSEGDMVVYEKSVYESLTDSNVDDPPDEGAAKETPTWVRLGRANIWRMWRDGADSRSERDGNIETTVALSRIVTAVGLVGLLGSEARVTLTDDTEGVVYDETKSVTDIGVVNWWEYFFSGYAAHSALFFTGLPSYGDADLTIKVSGESASAEVQVGRAVFGQELDIGVTLDDVTIRSEDFSRKVRDEFGNLELTPRRTLKLLEYDVMIQPAVVDMTERRLNALAAAPALFVGDKSIPESIVFGVYENFNINVNGHSITEASISVQEF